MRLISSPGDAAVVQPLLSSHDDVESAPQVVRLHVHDLTKRREKPFMTGDSWESEVKGQDARGPARRERGEHLSVYSLLWDSHLHSAPPGMSPDTTAITLMRASS